VRDRDLADKRACRRFLLHDDLPPVHLNVVGSRPLTLPDCGTAQAHELGERAMPSPGGGLIRW